MQSGRKGSAQETGFVGVIFIIDDSHMVPLQTPQNMTPYWEKLQQEQNSGKEYQKGPSTTPIPYPATTLAAEV